MSRFRRLKQRFKMRYGKYAPKALRNYVIKRRERRAARRSNKPKIFTMRWFKKNWIMLSIAAIAAYFLSAKFKDWADTNVLSKLKKTA